MDKHTNLKYAVIGFLESVGAVDIVEDYRMAAPPGQYPGIVIVDVAARLPSGQPVAVECGLVRNTGMRLKALISSFDVVYWAPVMPFLFRLDRKDLDTFSRYAIHYKCKMCDYEWNPRKQDPKVCPRCKSRSWQKEKVVA